MVFPEELRNIIGQRERVEIGLQTDARAREKRTTGIINSFHAKIEEAQEVLVSHGGASKPTLSTAANAHIRSALERDNLARATIMDRGLIEPLSHNRKIYPNRLHLLVTVRGCLTACIEYQSNGFRWSQQSMR